MESWRGLPPDISEQYAVIRLIKRTEDKEIILLQNRTDSSRVILRNYPGELSQVYALLLNKKLTCIPRILAAVQRPCGSYVLEEFVEGSSPCAGKLSLSEILNLLHDLCRALHDLHALGIIHRDIKPGNLIVAENGTTYLMDLDAARIYKSSVDHDTCLLGTSGFAAPEQFGITQTDHRADIFSMGVTLNLLITGFHPSEKLCSGWWRHIVLRCTKIDPKARYQTAMQVWRSAYLFIALPDRLLRSRPFAAASAAAVFLVLCAISVYGFYRYNSSALPVSEAASAVHSAEPAAASAEPAASASPKPSQTPAPWAKPTASPLPGAIAAPAAFSQEVSLPHSASAASAQEPASVPAKAPAAAPSPAQTAAPTKAPTPTPVPKPTPIPNSMKEGYSEVLAAAQAYDAALQHKEKCEAKFLDIYKMPHNRKLDEINYRMGPIDTEYQACKRNTQQASEKLQALQAAEPRDEAAIAAAQSEYAESAAREAQASAANDAIMAEHQNYVNSPEFQAGYAEEQAICNKFYASDLELMNAEDHLRQVQNQYGIYLRNI